MESSTLDRYRTLNEQLAALVEAGVPLDLTWLPADQPARETLDRINTTVARRVSRGESLREALTGDDEVPPAYRGLVDVGLERGELTTALAGPSRMATMAASARALLSSALLYPVIVVLFVYGGLILLSLNFVPTLVAFYDDLGRPPGPALQWLLLLRNTLPYWATLVPLLLLVWLVTAARANRSTNRGPTSRRFLARLPGFSSAMFHERAANFADTLAELLTIGQPLDEALPVAAASAGDRQLATGADELAGELRATGEPSADSSLARRFPPFLRWALWQDTADFSRPEALAIAGVMYRDAAEHRFAQLRTVIPMLGVLFVGGTATLLYGLATFLPLVELLNTIAR